MARINRTDENSGAVPPEPVYVDPSEETEEGETVDFEDGEESDDTPFFRDSRPQANAPVLKPSEHPPFLYSWSGGYAPADTDTGWVPHLVRHRLIGGVGGVSQGRDGVYEVGGLVFNCQRSGKLLLSAQVKEYCRRIPGHPKCYAEPWARVTPKGAVLADGPEGDAWKLSLVKRGVIPRPSADELRGMIDDLERNIGDGNGSRESILAALNKRKAKLEGQLSAMEG